MKILFIANSEKIGGGNKSLLALAEQLNMSGHESVTISPDEGPFTELLEKNELNYRVFPTRFYDQATVKIVWYIFKAYVLIKKIRPDVIHANDVYCYKYFASIADFLKIPIVCHFRHFIDENMAGYLLDVIPEKAIFNSQYNLERTVKACKGALAGLPASVIYNFFDEKDYFQPQKRNALRKEWQLDDAQKVFLVIGNINPGKGHLDLIEAISQLRLHTDDKHSGVHFIVAGEDVTHSGIGLSLRSLIADKGLAEVVSCIGFVNDTAAAYAAADWVVIPSTEEPFGRVAVEAVLARKPIVARNNSGLREILEPLVTPVLSKDDSVPALTLALQESLYVTPDKDKLEADAAFTAERFSKASQFDKLLADVYQTDKF